MGKDVHHYCTHCVTCQRTKAVSTQPAPLHPVIASQPWELVAVDIISIEPPNMPQLVCLHMRFCLDLILHRLISHLDPPDYSSLLQGKLLELRELIDANTVEMANRQLQSYQSKEPIKLLDNPTKGKLDPRWTGPWRVRKWKGPLNVKI